MQPLPLPSSFEEAQSSGCTARNWEYIAPEQSFIPQGRSASKAKSEPDFDCCGIFMAKQNPVLTPQYDDASGGGAAQLPLFYAGSNGAFFGPRAGALGVAYVGRHAFAGLALSLIHI